MIKQVALLKARAGIARGELIDRYEREHAPLVSLLLPHFSDYRRSYVVPGSLMGGAAAALDFDVVTELWYEDADQLARLARAGEDAEAVRASEARLFDPAASMVVTCDEFVTPGSRLQPRPAGHDGRPAIKLMGFLRKRADMSREGFVARYEQGHCAVALDVLKKGDHPVFADYRRTFARDEGGSSPPFDVLTEAWFWTEEDYRHFLALHADPRIGAILAEDEAALFDRASITIFAADEHISAPAAQPIL
ncbi:EthD domain-containing protein [Rhizorhabdus wittichii]|uniref:EthD domain-containing protein n=1 Tax=Rhizorhabdus wittichii TaxID=160791 RepID=UPI0003145ABC|nr:EthD domain-containing protein [Rhizorhabdus wittichii]